LFFLPLPFDNLSGLLPNKCGQCLHDRFVIPYRIGCDPPKRCNPPNTNRKFVTSKLVGRTSKSLSDLTLLIEPKLTEGEIQANEQNGAGEALNQGRPDVVLEPKSLIHDLVTLRRIIHVSQ
jgi:hypothetical protein